MKLLAWAAVLVLSGCAAAGSPKAPMADAADNEPGDALLTIEGTPIALRRSVVADQYFWLRTKVLEGEAPPAFAEAFNAMHELRTDLSGDPTAYEDLEVPLGVVSHASELLAIYGELPDRKEVGGRVVPFRADALRLAQAMTNLEGAYKKGPYREHAVAIGLAAKDLGLHLVPFEPTILKAIESEKEIPASHGVYNFTPTDHFGLDTRGRVLLTVKDGNWAVLK